MNMDVYARRNTIYPENNFVADTLKVNNSTTKNYPTPPPQFVLKLRSGSDAGATLTRPQSSVSRIWYNTPDK